jgi:hypothetical protein
MTDIEPKVSALVNGVAFVKNGKAIPADDVYLTKPDPLVSALEGVTFDHYPPNDAKTIRAALDARGLEIREKGQPWLRTYDEHLK